MKSFLRYWLTVTVAVILIPSCKKDQAEGVYTNDLFASACNYLPCTVFGDVSDHSVPWLQFWNGYLSESMISRHGLLGNPFIYSQIAVIYNHPLKSLDRIIRMNEDPKQKDLPNVLALGSNDNQIAAAKTLEAFYYMFLTDMIGPIVLTDAFQGNPTDSKNPVYDTQRTVYEKLNSILDDAYALFNESGGLYYSDLLYSGDIRKWKKLNASLRMLLAIKLCDVDAKIGKNRFAKAYSDGGMTAVTDGLDYAYGNSHVRNRLYYWCANGYPDAPRNIVPNMILVEAMKGLEDNRMFAYFDIEGYKGPRSETLFPRTKYSSFYGNPFGLSSDTDMTLFNNSVCSINNKMLAMNARIPVIPTARILLTEAEAACRGWISADAKKLYEAGIRASFEWWNAGNADSYISSPNVAYRGGDEGFEQIVLQRWIASYLSDGVEAWSDWRRLDRIELPVGPAAIDIGIDQYPYRLGFCTDKSNRYTNASFKDMVSDLRGGANNTASRLWWDVVDNKKVALTEEQCTPPTIAE